MAKIKHGSLAGAVSGSIGNVVFSHNRGGAYIRSRTIPVNKKTPAQMNIRAILAQLSSAWASLTSAKQAAWNTWAQSHPVSDRLGEKIVLSGHQAMIACNSRLIQAGDTEIDVPPALPAPGALSSLTATFDIGAGDFEIAFTPTPLAATERLFVEAAVVSTLGIKNFNSLYKLAKISDKAQATDLDCSAEIAAIFGTLAAGQGISIRAYVVDSTTGLASPPMAVSGAIVST